MNQVHFVQTAAQNLKIQVKKNIKTTKMKLHKKQKIKMKLPQKKNLMKMAKTTKKKMKLHKKQKIKMKLPQKKRKLIKIPKMTKKKAKTKLQKKMKKIPKTKRKSLRKKLKKILQIQMMVKKSIAHFAILKLMMKPISVRNAENQ